LENNKQTSKRVLCSKVETTIYRSGGILIGGSVWMIIREKKSCEKWKV